MKRNLIAIFLTLIIICYCGFTLFLPIYIEEDAFIVFKYAENLVNGYGIVFNKGERVEACSTTTWLFLLTLFRLLGFELPTTARIIGIVLGCFSLFLIYRITSHFTDKIPWVILPSLLTAISIPFVMWNQLGLETPLYTAIFLSLILTCLDRSTFIYWPIIALLLILTRPETPFIVLGLVPVFYFYRDQRRRILYSGIILLVVCLTLMILRFLYFHDFVPTAFYIKIHPNKYRFSLSYLHLFLKSYYMYYLSIPLLYLVLKRWNWQEKRSILFGFMIVYLIWAALGGAEYPKPFYRPFVPVIPVIYMYIISGIDQALGQSGVRRRFLFSGLVYTAIIAFAFAILFLSKNYWFALNPMANPVAQSIKNFRQEPLNYIKFCLNQIREPAKNELLEGEFIKRNYLKGSILVYDAMGALPYGAGIDYHIIDSWGLTDVKIGRYYFHQKIQGKSLVSNLLRLYERVSTYLIKRFFPDTEFLYTRDEALDYIFRQNPDVILYWTKIFQFKEQLPYFMIRDHRFRDNYTLKYFIGRTALVFERDGIVKKPLNIPEGFSVVFTKDIPAAIGRDHPIFQASLHPTSP